MDRTVQKPDANFPAQPKLLNVATCGRVSSGKDAMLHSLSAHVSCYAEMIQRHPGWNYCGVYADETMIGMKDNRENFQQLIANCRAGKIGMVITKSISRFARNTLTLLNTVREFKERGIDVYFEEQDIHTMSSNGEVPQYYIEHSHDAIILPEDWKLVQLEMTRRKNLGRRYSKNSVFDARLTCEDCGGSFGAKTWNSTNKYRRTVRQCNDKFKYKEHRCTTPHLNEDGIKTRFITVYNNIILGRETS